MNKIIAPIFLLTLVLTGCGGGGSDFPAPLPKPISLTEVVRTTVGSNLVTTMASGDLNNDGLEDIVVGGWVNDGTHLARIYVFYQNANGSLTERTTEVLPSWTYQGSQRIFIADFDNDGRNDIVLPGFDDGHPQPLANTVIFWNNSGRFVRQDLSDQVQAHGACYNDIDRDGDLDMLIGGANGGIYVNQGNRTFQINTTVLPDFFATCSVVHNHNNTVSVMMGNTNQVSGYPSSIQTLDYNLNTVSVAGVPNPPGMIDLVNTVVADVNGDGYTDFIAVFNEWDSGDPGVKQVWLNNGQGAFSAQTPFDTVHNNAFYSHKIFTGGRTTILFGAINGDMKIYQIVNGQFVIYKQNVLDSMASEFGLVQGNWRTGYGTIYQNTVTGRVYVLQYLNGKYYTKELA